MSWDAVLNSWNINMLLRSTIRHNYYPFFNNIITKGFSRHGDGCQFAMRSECLGTGIGAMVMDLPSDVQEITLPVTSQTMYKGVHMLLLLESLQKYGSY